MSEEYNMLRSYKLSKKRSLTKSSLVNARERKRKEEGRIKSEKEKLRLLCHC